MRVGLNWAEHTVEIEAPIETCFEAIVDYESFPQWQGAVVATEVLDRHRDGLGKKVRLFVDAKIRKVDYTLDYRYRPPTLIEWDFVEGNGINDADGSYTFEDLGADRTRATYKFGLEVGIPLPGPVARRAHKQTLKASVEDLKREAERRARSAEAEQASAEETADEDEPLASKRFIGALGRGEETTAKRPVQSQPDRSEDQSVTDAAAEVLSASVKLGRAVASRSLGAAGKVIYAARRLRP
jgi:uncharacterized membrane protein